MRLAALLALVLAGGPAAAACDLRIADARYEDATTSYGHDVMGPGSEWLTLALDLVGAGCEAATAHLRLPEGWVFEGRAPLLADADGDGAPEVLSVQSSPADGSRLALYGIAGDRADRLAATRFIGEPRRWIAPVGAGDLDGDGIIEIAAVDRPHLARTLRLYHVEDGRLTQVAERRGVTNHRFGEGQILGGFRRCSGRREIVLALADWSGIAAIRWDGRTVSAFQIAEKTGPDDFDRALRCQ